MSDFKKYVTLIENYSSPVSTPLYEGVTFGNKAKQQIINSGQIRMGVEYEFWANDDELFGSIGNSPSDTDINYVSLISNGELDFERVTDEKKFDQLVVAEKTVILIKHNHNSGEEYFMLPGNTYLDFYLDEISEERFNNGVMAMATGHDYDVIEVVVESLEAMDRWLTTYYENKDQRDPINLSGDDQLEFDREVIGDVRAFNIKPLCSMLYHVEFDDFEEDNDHYAFMEVMDLEIAYDELMREQLLPALEELGITHNFEESIKSVSSFSDNQRLSELFDIIDSVAERSSELVFEMPSFEVKFYGDMHGIEYYAATYDEKSSTNIYQVLDSYGVSYDNVVPDSDMIEVITDALSIPESLSNMKTMFQLIGDLGSTSDASGMHVSISSLDWQDEFNAEKFFILLNIDHIHNNLFGARYHVNNFNGLVENILEKSRYLDMIFDVMIENKNSGSIKDVIDGVYEVVRFRDIAKEKYQTVNLGSYHVSNGRVELRYFGGENYEERYEEIEQEILRASYLLDISYGDLYDREYQKYRYIYMDNMFRKVYENGIHIFFLACNAAKENKALLDDDKWKIKGETVSKTTKFMIRQQLW